MARKYSLGIDLGTSNSALALSSGEARPEIVQVAQHISEAAIGERPLFPSSLYFPLEPGSGIAPLPWGEDGGRGPVCGVLARERGALLPDRLVSSAKSWLCNAHVDRRSKILPWRSEIGSKISPLEASQLLLEHLLNAFRAARPDAAADHGCVLTVPASFDEVARNLTHEAAVNAGLQDVVLIEEPIAAFYAWIAQSHEGWRKQIGPGDVVLVCDIGGGTADFSLIAVAEERGELALHRIAVGDHILLGGDNMDLALAYAMLGKLEAQGHSLDHWQFLSLVQGARQAKERLFGEHEEDTISVSVPSRGSSLFAKTISTALTREQATSVILEGYFPLTSIDEVPPQQAAHGLQEFGLPYASEPALSKHLALFLKRALQNARSSESLLRLVPGAARADVLFPTAVLFNGGVFNSRTVRERMMEILRRWNPEQAPRELEGAQFDLAVARGAAYYGSIRESGKGLRIRSGTSRSYYIGVESPMPAVPGIRRPLRGLCIVQQGMEEGTEAPLTGREFGLLTGQEAQFRFFSSNTRAGDTIGAGVEDAERELEEISSLSLTLPAAEGGGQLVPVRLRSVFTELGTLELWMDHAQTGQSWRLQFNVRALEDSTR